MGDFTTMYGHIHVLDSFRGTLVSYLSLDTKKVFFMNLKKRKRALLTLKFNFRPFYLVENEKVEG